MTKHIISGFSLVLVVAYSLAQAPPDQGSPKKVIEQYLEMVQDGALLTSAGWSQVSALSPPQAQSPQTR
jgi:hypothetical protein